MPNIAKNICHIYVCAMSDTCPTSKTDIDKHIAKERGGGCWWRQDRNNKEEAHNNINLHRRKIIRALHNIAGHQEL